MVTLFPTSGEVALFFPALVLFPLGRWLDSSSSSSRPMSMPAQPLEGHSPLTFSERKRERERKEGRRANMKSADCDGVLRE